MRQHAWRRFAVAWLRAALYGLVVGIGMAGGGLLVRWIFLRRRRVVLRPTAYTTPPIESDAINPHMRRIIISDVHLGAGDRLDDFDDDEQLIAFIDHYVTNGTPTELILAGDTLEFLQVRLPHLDDDEYSDRAADLRVRMIIKAHAGVFAALSRFMETPANQLTFLIGNHDFELHYPAAKNAIRRTLGLDSDERQLRFGVSYRGGGIYLVHGNQFDSWNRFLNFDGISEPFEIPRGTQMVKEVVNELEDDPLPQAPLLDNVKPTSAFLWYMLALPRLRDRAARSFTLRGIAGYMQVAAWPTPHHMPITGEGPGGFLSIPALAWFWHAVAVFRRGRVARQHQVSRSVSHVADIVDPPTEVIDRVQIEATRQFEREARAFRDRYAREMLNLARSTEHRHLNLFVCGHTHRAAVVPLGLGQYYVNTGTWTEIIYDLATMRRQEQRFPFLEVTYPDGDRPRWSLLVWYGRDEPPLLWQEGSVAAGRPGGRAARDQV